MGAGALQRPTGCAGAGAWHTVVPWWWWPGGMREQRSGAPCALVPLPLPSLPGPLPFRVARHGDLRTCALARFCVVLACTCGKGRLF